MAVTKCDGHLLHTLAQPCMELGPKVSDTGSHFTVTHGAGVVLMVHVWKRWFAQQENMAGLWSCGGPEAGLGGL